MGVTEKGVVANFYFVCAVTMGQYAHGDRESCSDGGDGGANIDAIHQRHSPGHFGEVLGGR